MFLMIYVCMIYVHLYMYVCMRVVYALCVFINIMSVCISLYIYNVHYVCSHVGKYVLYAPVCLFN